MVYNNDINAHIPAIPTGIHSGFAVLTNYSVEKLYSRSLPSYRFEERKRTETWLVETKELTNQMNTNARKLHIQKYQGHIFENCHLSGFYK